jgi:hypothetical protein
LKKYREQQQQQYLLLQQQQQQQQQRLQHSPAAAPKANYRDELKAAKKAQEVFLRKSALIFCLNCPSLALAAEGWRQLHRPVGERLPRLQQVSACRCSPRIQRKVSGLGRTPSLLPTAPGCGFSKRMAARRSCSLCIDPAAARGCAAAGCDHSRCICFSKQAAAAGILECGSVSGPWQWMVCVFYNPETIFDHEIQNTCIALGPLPRDHCGCCCDHTACADQCELRAKRATRAQHCRAAREARIGKSGARCTCSAMECATFMRTKPAIVLQA